MATNGQWPLQPPTAESLLRLYREGDSAFVSPACSVLTRGAYAQLDIPALSQLPSRAATLLDEVARDGEVEPLLIGAVAFGERVPPRLIVPEGVIMGAGVKDGSPHGVRASALPGERVAGLNLPSAARYRSNVEEALRCIAAGQFEKVVLSRAMRVQAQVQARRLMQLLLPRNVLGYTFAVDLGVRAGQGATALVGASPELLLSKRGRHVVSHPLAGSVPRAQDPVEDQARAARLLSSLKDQREHTYVVDAVAQALAPHCRKLLVPPKPSLVATATMWHLGTRITGDLDDPEASALALAMALHPTPAVCGHPRRAAQDFIQRVEGFERDYFAGLVGWVNGQGDGEWAVTIRCAEVAEQHATLYAGAGIVMGSDPALELAETEAKMQTMLSAMNVALRKEAA
ncbi:MAG: isochorismate synthase [Rubrivivax sp.]|nr:MAG: isochorismate synthase [Rubrivivax sp.]